MIDLTLARRIASEWHGGMWTALYGFASTGVCDHPHMALSEVEECLKIMHAEGAADCDAYGDLLMLKEYFNQFVTEVTEEE